MIKLDDFLSKKKEPSQVLDLSKIKISSKDDFKKYYDKIPEIKVKPEKIVIESIKIKDKDFSFVPGKREEKQTKDWSYPDPTPPDMKGAKLEDLCPVNIDWKMLTTLRPKTKVEEDMFSRLVQLGKLDLKYQNNLKREKPTDWVRKTKNPKSSIMEMKVVCCKDCGEDFCDGSMCSKLTYENFFRPQASTSGQVQDLSASKAEDTKKKKKKKKKRKRKNRKRSVGKGRRKLGKNSIFNRTINIGCNRDHSRRSPEIIEKPRKRAVSCTRSFSGERRRRSFYEGRSKSAPRIHFECDLLGSKSFRYEVFDSGPSQTDYSSQSDSESTEYHKRFFASRLRLSGKRKLLSARVGLAERNRRTSLEGSPSGFVRRCTLYKGYHSDASVPDVEDSEDTSSKSSTPPRSRSISKSPERRLTRSTTSAKYPSTIQIQFDDFFSPAGLRFPEKMFLPNRPPLSSSKKKDHKSQKFFKATEGFPKIDFQFNRESTGSSGSCSRRTRTCPHTSRSKASKLSKFSGPYLKAKGLFGKKSD